MDQRTHDKGLGIRKAALGEAYVANALKNADDFNPAGFDSFRIAREVFTEVDKG